MSQYTVAPHPCSSGAQLVAAELSGLRSSATGRSGAFTDDTNERRNYGWARRRRPHALRKIHPAAKQRDPRVRKMASVAEYRHAIQHRLARASVAKLLGKVQDWNVDCLTDGLDKVQ